MKIEYPKMVYKTREDYKIVQSIEDEELAAESGYGDFEVMVLGIKPEGVAEVSELESIADDESDDGDEEQPKKRGRPKLNK